MTPADSSQAPLGAASQLAARIERRAFTVTSELTPPKGIDLAPLLSRANALRNHVHAFNLTDSHNARMSLSPLAAAHLLMDHGYEPIVQLTTRDRNRIALQSDMLGAAALGVANLVLMGGDDPGAGDHPLAKAVFDLSTEELLAAAHALNCGRDASGKPLQGAPRLFVGAVVNPGAQDLDREIARMEAKVAAGAQFFQTQAIFDVAAFERFVARVSHLEVALLAGVIPIKSVKMAQYMNANVPGIEVPDWAMKRIAQSSDVEGDSAAISAALIEGVRASAQGVHIMAIGWESIIPRVLEQAGL